MCWTYFNIFQSIPLSDVPEPVCLLLCDTHGLDIPRIITVPAFLHNDHVDASGCRFGMRRSRLAAPSGIARSRGWSLLVLAVSGFVASVEGSDRQDYMLCHRHTHSLLLDVVQEYQIIAYSTPAKCLTKAHATPELVRSLPLPHLFSAGAGRRTISHLTKSEWTTCHSLVQTNRPQILILPHLRIRQMCPRGRIQGENTRDRR